MRRERFALPKRGDRSSGGPAPGVLSSVKDVGSQWTEVERFDLGLRPTNHTDYGVAYTDKLDGKITDDLWERKSNDWRMEEQQVKWRFKA